MMTEPPSDHPARYRLIGELVSALRSCDFAGSESGMAQFRRELPRWVQVQPQGFGPTVQLEMARIVNRVSEIDFGMARLPALITVLEGDTTQVREINRIVAEWYAYALLSEDDATRLRPVLELITKPIAHEGFRQATGASRGQPPDWCEHGWHMFTHLTTLNANPSGLLPCLAFLTFAVAARRVADDHDGAAVLDNWQLSSPDGELTAVRETAHRDQLRNEPPATNARYLVILVQPDTSPRDDEEADAPTIYHVSYGEQWRVGGEVHPQPGRIEVDVNEADLEEKVGQIICRAERDWQGDKAPPDLTIEFVLPMELLNTGIEWWQRPFELGKPAEIALYHPVVLRSFDRWQLRSLHSRWRRRWRQLRTSPQASRTISHYPSDTTYLHRLEAEIQNDQHVVGLVLSAPPPTDPDVGASDFVIALRTGLPVIIWHRKDCALPAFREAVTELTSDGAIPDLPSAVQELRLEVLQRQSTDRPDHVGRHLALLWDDEDRGPHMFKPAIQGRPNA